MHSYFVLVQETAMSNFTSAIGVLQSATVSSMTGAGTAVQAQESYVYNPSSTGVDGSNKTIANSFGQKGTVTTGENIGIETIVYINVAAGGSITFSSFYGELYPSPEPSSAVIAFTALPVIGGLLVRYRRKSASLLAA